MNYRLSVIVHFTENSVKRLFQMVMTFFIIIIIFCILLFLFVSCAMDKQRDTVMLVFQFYIKKGYTHTKKKKTKKRGGKEAYYNVNINRSLHTSSQNIN